MGLRPARGELFARLFPPLGVAAVGVGIPLVVTLSTGAFGIPHVDDWAYFRVDAALLHTGGIHLVGLGPMTLVGHLVWGLPFLAVLGSSIDAAHWAGTAASAIALVAAYVLFSRFVPKRAALFGTAALAAVPIFALLATSYMTDTSALAAQLVCLALGAAALDRTGARRTQMLAGSLAVGFLGFAIREPSIAAPLAVLAGHAVAGRREGRSIAPLGAVLVGFLALCGALWVWRQGLPHSQAGGVPGAGGETASFSGRLAARKSLALLFTLAFVVLPVLVLRIRTLGSTIRRPACAAVAAVTLLVGLDRLHVHAFDEAYGVFVAIGGNYVSQYPVGLEGGQPPAILTNVPWALVLGAAVAAGACLAALLVERGLLAGRRIARRRLDAFSPPVWTMIVFGVLAAAFVFARAATNDPLYDRYLLPVIPAVLLLVLASRSRGAELRPAWTSGGVALAAIAALALLYVGDVSSRTVARWHAGERLVALGYPARDVDAGFDWIGIHYAGSVTGGATAAYRWRSPWPFKGLFPRAGNCGLVDYHQHYEPWLRLLRTESYRASFGLRREKLWLYRNERACAAESLGGVGG